MLGIELSEGCLQGKCLHPCSIPLAQGTSWVILLYEHFIAVKLICFKLLEAGFCGEAGQEEISGITNMPHLTGRMLNETQELLIAS